MYQDQSQIVTITQVTSDTPPTVITHRMRLTPSVESTTLQMDGQTWSCSWTAMQIEVLPLRKLS